MSNSRPPTVLSALFRRAAFLWLVALASGRRQEGGNVGEKSMPFGPKKLTKICGVNTGDLVPVSEFDGYYVTQDGRVFCLRELSQRLWPDGYARVSLGGQAGRKNKTGRHGAGVHRLMAMAMLPRKAGQTVVRHLDGDRLNNVLENLAWGTCLENSSDTIRHGRSGRGEKNHKSKLSEEQVLAFRERYENGESCPTIAKEAGVHRHTVYAAVSGQNWGWLISGSIPKKGGKHAS